MCVKVDHIPMVFKFFIKKSDFSIQKQSKFCRSKIFSIQKTRRPYKKQRQETYKRVSCRRRRHDTLSFLAKPRSLVSVGVLSPSGRAHPRYNAVVPPLKGGHNGITTARISQATRRRLAAATGNKACLVAKPSLLGLPRSFQISIK